jgi:hypothetical protein
MEPPNRHAKGSHAPPPPSHHQPRQHVVITSNPPLSAFSHYVAPGSSSKTLSTPAVPASADYKFNNGTHPSSSGEWDGPAANGSSSYYPAASSTSDSSKSHQTTIGTVEMECLEHYETNLEKYKDERDAIQKKTFTKWMNKHLTKNGLKVNDLFVDLQDGLNLIALLESFVDDPMLRESGSTRFHRIQNVQRCLDFLRKRHIRVVNIRAEDIVDGNPKLTLGLIWTIILNFQVSVINQRRREQQLAREEMLNIKTLNVTARKGDIGGAVNGQSGVLYDNQPSSATSTLTAKSDGLSARDALLQWAKRVTSGYSGVNVTNFTSSWRDGLAFNAIAHYYRPQLVNWSRVSERSVNSRERLRQAFDAFEREWGISKLLDPEDVDVEQPDEKSIITYVSSLYNTLESSKGGNLDDLISRLSRGIGITNEKLDHLLARIEESEARAETVHISETEQAVRGIVSDLNALETPINEFFDDVDVLKRQRHVSANDFHKQVYGLHQRKTTYLDRLLGKWGERFGLQTSRQYVTERFESTRSNSFQRVEEAIKWVREKLDLLNNMQFSEALEVLEDVFERHKVDNRDIQDYRQTVDECIARQAEVSAQDSFDYCELLQTLESEYQQLRELSAGRMLDLVCGSYHPQFNSISSGHG